MFEWLRNRKQMRLSPLLFKLVFVKMYFIRRCREFHRFLGWTVEPKYNICVYLVYSSVVERNVAKIMMINNVGLRRLC